MIVKTTTTKDNNVTSTTAPYEEQGTQALHALHEAIDNAGIGSTITQSWLIGHAEIQVCRCEIEDDGRVLWVQSMDSKAIVIG